MRPNLFVNILKAIRGRGHQDSLKSLKRAGYERLTVLSVKDLDDAISRAVDSTLREYGLTLDPEELRGLTGEAQTAFLKLVNECSGLRELNEALEREKKNLIGQGALLRQEVSKAQGLLDVEKRAAKSDPPVDAGVFETKLRDAARFYAQEHVLKLGDPADPKLSSEFHSLSAEVVGVALSLVREANQRVLEDARRQQEEKMAVLEQRVRKLQSSLEHTEALLARVRTTATPQEETGVESKFKAVQGLDPSDQRFQQKKMLLKQIFDLNIELRRLMADNGSGSSK